MQNERPNVWGQICSGYLSIGAKALKIRLSGGNRQGDPGVLIKKVPRSEILPERIEKQTEGCDKYIARGTVRFFRTFSGCYGIFLGRPPKISWPGTILKLTLKSGRQTQSDTSKLKGVQNCPMGVGILTTERTRLKSHQLPARGKESKGAQRNVWCPNRVREA